MSNRQKFKIGTTQGNMEHLDDLATPLPPPKSTYSPVTSTIELADGSYRGIGAPQASWHWDFLTQAQRDLLRTYCTGVSSNVYIKTCTKDAAGVFKGFYCKMVWPVTDEDTKATRALDFTIKFKQMIDVT